MCPLCNEPIPNGPVSHLTSVHKRTVEEAMEIVNRLFKQTDPMVELLREAGRLFRRHQEQLARDILENSFTSDADLQPRD